MKLSRRKFFRFGASVGAVAIVGPTIELESALATELPKKYMSGGPILTEWPNDAYTFCSTSSISDWSAQTRKMMADMKKHYEGEEWD